MRTVAESLAIAVQHHQAGEIQAAEQVYRQILAIDPNCADALHLLGVIALGTGNHDAAVHLISRAIELNGNASFFNSNLGNAFQAQGKLDKAVASYRRALELKPDNAEAHSNLGNALLDQGKLEESLECFRRALELKPDFAEAHYNLGNALQAQGNLNEAVVSYHRALELKPNHAEAHCNLGTTFQAQGNLNEAVVSYRRALELKPDYAAAHCNLGSALQILGKLDDAVVSYHRALALNPDLADAHNYLGDAFQAQGKLDQAFASFRQAVELRPDFTQAHHNLGCAFQAQGKLDEAACCFSRALELNPEFAEAHGSQALLNLSRGNFQHGWPEYEWRWKSKLLAERKFTQPQWDGKPLENRTILLHAEQGLGDTIQFVRYAAVVKKQNPGATVIAECQRTLAKLLASCPDMDQLIVQGDELPPFDVHSPLLSLPGIFKTTVATIPADVPYLFADPALVAQWQEHLGKVSGMRVGVNWKGRLSKGEFRKRNIPLEHFAALAQLPGISLISLHKGEGRDDLVNADETVPILDLGSDFDTVHGAFMDTAAIMKNLDLVITSDTSIPHLAGALGVPVWLALPYVPDWRWLLDRSDSPWYPTMRLFRQKAPGDWIGVFDDIQAALRQLLNSG